ncbi:MAG: hypothetical protein CSA24_02215 [Deltaproteobacteria bacterium]|nr:MAG: hypothetical protein CSA24_02215 [Deltaproteobacteria bacterium]
MAKTTAQSFGLLAEFDSPKAIYHACEAIRDEGFKHWDAHTPFPVHGLDKAMGIPASRVPWIVLGLALFGMATGFTLQWWTMTIEYPTVIAGKPFFAWPAFVPVIFELSILFGAFGAVFGMFGLNRLPRFHHPVFNSDRFKAATDDKFFVSIEARDPLYDKRKTKKMLKKLGASYIEEVGDE